MSISFLCSLAAFPLRLCTLASGMISATSLPACREPTRLGAASLDRHFDTLHSCSVALLRPGFKPAGPHCLSFVASSHSARRLTPLLFCPPTSPQHRHTEWVSPLHTHNRRTETNDPAFSLLPPSPLHILTPALRNQRCCTATVALSMVSSSVGSAVITITMQGSPHSGTAANLGELLCC